LTLLMKALLLDADPSTRWISSLLEGGPAPPEDEDADATADATPDRASGAPADRIPSVADGQGPLSSGTEAKRD
jgi:hypothetical protein